MLIYLVPEVRDPFLGSHLEQPCLSEPEVALGVIYNCGQHSKVLLVLWSGRVVIGRQVDESQERGLDSSTFS